MAELVRRVREAERLIGNGEKRPQLCEQDAATALRRSIAAKGDLRAGTCLCVDDITWLRPGTGIAPGGEARVLGRKLKRSLSMGDLITPDVLE